MPRRPLLVAATAAGLVLAALAARWAMTPPAVPAVEVRVAPLVRTLQFSARVATDSRVEVGSTLTGRVRAVAVREGDRVAAGAVLVRLESEELHAALAQARAGERQAAARLEGLRSTGRRGAQAGTAQAGSVLAAAQADLQRTEDLVGRGFLSQARLDEARRAVAVARAQLDAAGAQQAAIAEPGADIAQAQAQLALARAVRAAAEARLSEAVVTAPADARVLARRVEPGQIVQPGRALIDLALAGPLQLVAQVDERYLGQLQPGQPAGVRADAYPAQRLDARVRSISPLVDAQRGAVEVKLALATPLPAFLREDMTVSVEVETARRAQALVVPAEALRGGGAGNGGGGGNGGGNDGGRDGGRDALGADGERSAATVWVARDGRVEARAVRLGLRTLDAVEVVDGLAAGERVLVGTAPAPGGRVRADVAAPAQTAARGSREDAGSALTGAMGR